MRLSFSFPKMSCNWCLSKLSKLLAEGKVHCYQNSNAWVFLFIFHNFENGESHANPLPCVYTLCWLRAFSDLTQAFSNSHTLENPVLTLWPHFPAIRCHMYWNSWPNPVNFLREREHMPFYHLTLMHLCVPL